MGDFTLLIIVCVAYGLEGSESQSCFTPQFAAWFGSEPEFEVVTPNHVQKWTLNPKVMHRSAAGPVHTPDGSPCGLLNHLANSCRPVVEPAEDGAAEAVALALSAMGAEAAT